jgi:hypothetical protein
MANAYDPLAPIPMQKMADAVAAQKAEAERERKRRSAIPWTGDEDYVMYYPKKIDDATAQPLDADAVRKAVYKIKYVANTQLEPQYIKWHDYGVGPIQAPGAYFANPQPLEEPPKKPENKNPLYKPGTAVAIRPDSEFYGQWHGIGKVTKNNNEGRLIYTVDWPGYRNHYGHADLIEVQEERALKKTKNVLGFTSLGLYPVVGIEVLAVPGTPAESRAKGRTGVVLDAAGGYYVDVSWDGSKSIGQEYVENLRPKHKKDITRLFEIKARCEEREKEERERAKEVKKIDEVIVSETVTRFMEEHLKFMANDNQAAHRGRGFYPRLVLLGADENDVVVCGIKLPFSSDGCWAMVKIANKLMTKAYVHIAKLGLRPIGIARIGMQFDGDHGGKTYGGMGLIDISKMGGILVTVWQHGNFAVAALNDGARCDPDQRKEILYKTKDVPGCTIFNMNDNGLITGATLQGNLALGDETEVKNKEQKNNG